MKLYELKRRQVFPQSIDEIWDFFSSPHNLSRITPPDMKFEVKTAIPEEMYAGLLIEYRVRPLAGIPVTWVTEIKNLRKHSFFIDEQRFGPYSFWYHQHQFREIDEGTEVIDLVHYGLPFGFIGRFLHWAFIKSRLNSIFDYRQEVLKKLFIEAPVVNPKNHEYTH